MKAQQQRVDQQRHSRLSADLEAATRTIFRRCPTLCGFAVRGASNVLLVGEISVFPLCGLEAPAEIHAEIVAALMGFVDEFPEAGALLRERSFARVFH